MLLFNDIVMLWLANVKRRWDLAPSTKVCYSRVANAVMLWAQDLPSDKTIDLDGFVAMRAEAGLTPRTLRLELRVVAASWRWAIRQGIVVSPDLLRIPKIRLNHGLYYCNHRTPTPWEAGAVIREMLPNDWQLAVKLLARTGARVGEVVSLRRCDFSLTGRTITFGCSPDSSKTGARSFPLDAATVHDLAPRADGSIEPLLAFAGYRAPLQVIQRLLRSACDRAGVPRFTPHGLRRMVVTRLLRAGIDPGTAATLTGHTVQVMLRYYQQVSDDDRRVAVEKARLGFLPDE